MASICSFNIKILKLNKLIALGIADASLKGEFMFTKNNAIMLDNTGVCKIGDDSKRIDKGFSQGDMVFVSVNLKEGSIEWQVHRSEPHRLENIKMLQDKSITWVPYILLNDADCIELNNLSIK